MTITEADLTSAELDDLCDGLRAFITAEVVPRQRELSEAHQHLYRADGRFREEVLALGREVREASARAGYYGALAPEAIGGGGLGFEALYRLWETVFEACGA